MDDPVFIEDNLERSFCIAAESGIHGELLGTRVVMLDEAVQAYRYRGERYEKQNNHRAAEKLRNGMIAKQLTQWSVDRDITEGNVARIHPMLLAKLEGVCLGVLSDNAEDGEGIERGDTELVEEQLGN